MNTDQSLPPNHELVELIEKWFLEHGDLKHGEGIVVSISRISIPVNVTIKRSYPEVVNLIREAAEETRYVAILNIVSSFGEDPKGIVDGLYNIRVSELLKYRNVGKVVLKRFITALQKRDIQCPWFNL